MKAVIMAGGKGTRLRPLTNDIPKPMIKMIDKPVLLHTIELLKSHNITEIAVTLGHLPECIIDYFGDGRQFGVNIEYFIETTPLGTAGGVKNTQDFLSDDFLVLSGDSYTEIDLTRAMQFHYEKNALFTLVAQPHPYPLGLGVLDIDCNNKIIAFIEKPNTLKPALINTGIYVLNKQVLKFIPDGFYDFGKQLIPRLLGEVYAYIDYAYWSDIGTLVSYYKTNMLLAEARERETASTLV